MSFGQWAARIMPVHSSTAWRLGRTFAPRALPGTIERITGDMATVLVTRTGARFDDVPVSAVGMWSRARVGSDCVVLVSSDYGAIAAIVGVRWKDISVDAEK